MFTTGGITGCTGFPVCNSALVITGLGSVCVAISVCDIVCVITSCFITSDIVCVITSCVLTSFSVCTVFGSGEQIAHITVSACFSRFFSVFCGIFLLLDNDSGPSCQFSFCFSSSLSFNLCLYWHFWHSFLIIPLASVLWVQQ